MIGKKKIIPNLSGLSPIKDKEEENNNKDISLLVHNNISAIESKGEGKEDNNLNNINNINIKIKKDDFRAEDLTNQNQINDKKMFNENIMKRNKSSNLLIRHSTIKDNLDINNEANVIEHNNLNDGNYNDINEQKQNQNNIFIVNNAITPKIRNININININNNSNKIEENSFNKSDLNLNKKKTHYNNIFKKKDIKKEYFFSYDENMDDMIQSKNSIKNSKIEHEKENILKNNLKKDKLARFQKPKKLENIFTEEDIKTADLFDTCGNVNESKNVKIIKNSINNTDLTKSDKNTKKDKHNKDNIFDNNKHNKNKEHKHHHHNNNHKVINNNNYGEKKNEKNEEKKKNDKENNIKNIKTKSTKEIIKGLKYDDFKKAEMQLKNENIQSFQNSQNDGNKKKKRNRVKSVDDKLRKDNPACLCFIY